MLRERWIEWRNRRLASPAFQRAAVRFAPTRPTARAHADRLFDLVAGFTYSQTLFAAVRLGLFDMLREGALPVAEIAARTGLASERAERLVRAAAALDLLQLLGGGRVALGQAGAALAGNPGVLAMIAHHDRLYADLADPVALLRRGGASLADFWAYRSDDPEKASGYSALMAASQPAVAAELLDAYPVARHRRLLDVGGGEGAFLQAVAARAPRLELGLFDLPAVAERAAARVPTSVGIHRGRLPDDSLPDGYDLVTLVRVLHDHDDAPALAILRAVRAALPPGGRLLIGEPMAGGSNGRVGDAYFGWYLLAMGQGRAREPAAICDMLANAGFARSRRLKTRMPLITGAIVATA